MAFLFDIHMEAGEGSIVRRWSADFACRRCCATLHHSSWWYMTVEAATMFPGQESISMDSSMVSMEAAAASAPLANEVEARVASMGTSGQESILARK